MAFLNIIASLLAVLILISTSYAQYSKFRIQGGRNPKLNEVKYVVAVRSQNLICGGGIIGDKYIVTAAHCFTANMTTNTLFRPFKVIANTNSTSNYDKNVAIEVDVARAFIPAVRLVRKELGDIAVLELKKSLNIQNNRDTLEKLKLPKPWRTNPLTYPTYVNLPVTAAGYGATSTSRTPDNSGKLIFEALHAGQLHVAKATVIDEERCKKSWSSLNGAQMCVGVTEDPNRKKPQGLCNGDSGSPVVYDRYGHKEVIGVFSVNRSCNNNKYPSVLARISSHIPFIKNAMNGNVTKDMIVYN